MVDQQGCLDIINCSKYLQNYNPPCEGILVDGLDSSFGNVTSYPNISNIKTIDLVDLEFCLCFWGVLSRISMSLL